MHQLLLKMVVTEDNVRKIHKEIYQEIANQVDGKVYSLDSSKVTGAAFDLMALLTGGAAVANILSLLIQILEIGNHRESIHIYIEGEEPIIIHRNTTRAELIEYQRKLIVKFRDETSEFDKKLIEEAKYLGIWKKLEKEN